MRSAIGSAQIAPINGPQPTSMIFRDRPQRSTMLCTTGARTVKNRLVRVEMPIKPTPTVSAARRAFPNFAPAISANSSRKNGISTAEFRFRSISKKLLM